MALTTQEKIDRLNYFNQTARLKEILTDIREENISTEVQLEDVDVIGTTIALTAVPGVFADEAAVQTYLVTLRANTEARLDVIEGKVDEILEALKA